MDKFGPFVNIVATATALVAVFGLFLARMVGSTKQLGWLSGSETPPILIALGPRILAVVLIGVTYAVINASNYLWFALAGVLIGIFGFWAATRFDYLRKLHVVDIPVVGRTGRQAVDKKGNPVTRSIVIGSETDMLPDAKKAFAKARNTEGGLSLVQFMSGYGAKGEVNNPQAIWDRGLLAKISSKIATLLMYVILAAVLALFLGAIVVDVVQSDSSETTSLLLVHISTLLKYF